MHVYMTFIEYLALICNTESSGWLQLNMIVRTYMIHTTSSYIGWLSDGLIIEYLALICNTESSG